jgi:hypothetical protein
MKMNDQLIEPATRQEFITYINRLRTMKDNCIKDNWQTIRQLMKKNDALEKELENWKKT